jgi:hypothetical protein
MLLLLLMCPFYLASFEFDSLFVLKDAYSMVKVKQAVVEKMLHRVTMVVL